MKFTCKILIECPKQKLADLFINPEYLKHYQENFLRKEVISGTPAEVGTISKMYYKMGKGEMELTETILENQLPNYFKGQYHHKHMDNTMAVTFKALDEQRTEYIAEIHYTAFRGFFAKTMAFLTPFVFRKQVDKWLKNFKIFAEQH